MLDRWSAFRNNPAYDGNGVRLNAAGFRRSSIVPREKPPGTIRVFLLGASVAYGGETLYPEIDNRSKIHNEQTIDYLLEKRLNAAFPARRWEVINAAVKGYFVNQDLTLYLSAVQRYHPDYLVLLDGVNDVFAMLRSPDTYDGYDLAGLGDEFSGLTSPSSMSLRLMSSTWLLDHSALYRLIRERLARTSQLRTRRDRVRAGRREMTPEEHRRYRSAASKIGEYMRPVQQIQALAALAGTKTLFVLQPQIAVTHKQFTGTEAQLLEYWSKVDGPLYIRGFQTLYPLLANELSDGAKTRGYGFLDLTGVFDNMNVQTFTDYCHLTPDGNRAVADAIFNSFAGAQ
jgi:lysophospholipase L1-like esterase